MFISNWIIVPSMNNIQCKIPIIWYNCCIAYFNILEFTPYIFRKVEFESISGHLYQGYNWKTWYKIHLKSLISEYGWMPHIKQALSMPFNLCNVVFLWVKVEFRPISGATMSRMRNYIQIPWKLNWWVWLKGISNWSPTHKTFIHGTQFV